MRILIRYIKRIDAFNEKIGHLISWFTTLMVLTVCYNVFTRYALKSSSVALQEMEWHLFSVIFLLGAAYTFKHDKHVRVDFFYAKLSDKNKALINLTGNILFLIPFALLLIWTSRDFVINSFLIRESSPDPGGLPARYILKACIPLSFMLVLLQSISHTLKSLIIISGNAADTQGTHNE